jgi:hypothetical protein
LIFDGFWSHFGSQNGAKMDSKIDQNNDGFLDRSWKGFGAPTGTDETVKSDRPGSTGRSPPYCRANPPWPRRPSPAVRCAWPFLGFFFALPFRPCLGLKRPRLGLPWPCLSRPFLVFSRPCLALPLPSHFQDVLSMFLGRS